MNQFKGRDNLTGRKYVGMQGGPHCLRPYSQFNCGSQRGNDVEQFGTHNAKGLSGRKNSK